jgi:hypothetical protein
MRLPDSWTSGTPLAVAVRAIVILLALAGAIVLSVWGMDLSKRIGKLGGPGGPTPEQQVLALQTDLGRLRTENAKLNATMAANAAATKAAAATAEKLTAATMLQEQQARQIKALELENSKLKEEAVTAAPKLSASKKAGAAAKAKAASAASKAAPAPATVASASAKAAGAASKLVNHGLALRRFDAEQPQPKSVHYRFLLSQPATAPKLAGRLQLLVTGSKDGKVVVLKYPSEAKATAAQFLIRLGTLQRCEGLLALPEGVVVKSIQARVLEKGQVRIARSVTLKDAAHVRS